MSADKLELTIELPQREYHAGQDVTGQLDVRNVDDSVRNIKLWLEWRATKGTLSERVASETLVMTKRAIAGRARPSFKLKLPKAPLSYRGESFSIEWVVVAEIDVAWARDPHFEVPIVVLGAEYVRPAPAKSIELVRTPFFKPGVAIASVIGGLLVIGDVGLPMLGAPLTLAAGAGLIGVAGALTAARRHRAAQLGKPTAVLDPGTLVLGLPCKLRLALTPISALSRVEATYTLSCDERFTSGSGRSRHTVTRSVFTHTDKLGTANQLQPDRDVFFDVVLTTPADAPPTFAHPRHELVWEIHVEITFTPVGGGPSAVDFTVPIEATR